MDSAAARGHCSAEPPLLQGMCSTNVLGHAAEPCAQPVLQNCTLLMEESCCAAGLCRTEGIGADTRGMCWGGVRGSECRASAMESSSSAGGPFQHNPFRDSIICEFGREENRLLAMLRY